MVARGGQVHASLLLAVVLITLAGAVLRSTALAGLAAAWMALLLASRTRALRQARVLSADREVPSSGLEDEAVPVENAILYALEEANLRVVQHDRSQLRAQLDELGGAPFDANRVRVVPGNFELMYDMANAEERKELLRLVVRRIEFYGVGQDVRFELSTDVTFQGVVRSLAEDGSTRPPVIEPGDSWRRSMSFAGVRPPRSPRYRRTDHWST